MADRRSRHCESNCCIDQRFQAAKPAPVNIRLVQIREPHEILSTWRPFEVQTLIQSATCCSTSQDMQNIRSRLLPSVGTSNTAGVTWALTSTGKQGRGPRAHLIQIHGLTRTALAQISNSPATTKVCPLLPCRWIRLQMRVPRLLPRKTSTTNRQFDYESRPATPSKNGVSCFYDRTAAESHLPIPLIRSLATPGIP